LLKTKSHLCIDMSVKSYAKSKTNEMAASKQYAYADRQNRIIKERLDKLLKHIKREQGIRIAECDRESNLVFIDYQKCLMTSGNLEHESRPGSPLKTQESKTTNRASSTDNKKKKNLRFMQATFSNNSTSNNRNNDKIKHSKQEPRPPSNSREANLSDKRPFTSLSRTFATSDIDFIDNIFDDSTDDENEDNRDKNEDDDNDSTDYNYADIKVLNYEDDQPSTNLLDLNRSRSAPLAMLRNRQREIESRHIFSASPKVTGLNYSRINSSSLRMRNLSECQRISKKLEAFEEKRASAKLLYASKKTEKKENPVIDQKSRQSQWAMAKYTSINSSASASNNKKTQGIYLKRVNSSHGKQKLSFLQSGSSSNMTGSKHEGKFKETFRNTPQNASENNNSSKQQQKRTLTSATITSNPPDKVANTNKNQTDTILESPLDKQLRKQKEEIRRKNELILNDLNQKVKAFVKKLTVL
jgi:hypothetical protein